MQRALRPYATAGVAVLGAGLIYVTPVTAPHIQQRAVDLAAAELLLVGTIEQLRVIGPILEGFWLFVVFPVSLLLAYAWSEISQALGFDPYTAAAEGFGTGLQGGFDAALTGVIDPGLPARVSTALGDITALFSDAAGVLDPATMVQDVSTALDPSTVTSVLDLSAIADIGTVLSTTTIPDLGEILTSPMP